MAQHPSIKAVSFDDLHRLYGAIQFQDALGAFIACVNYPGISGNALTARAINTLIPFHSVPVFYKVKFVSGDAESAEIVDAMHVWPEQKDKHGWVIPPRFDTAHILAQSQGGVDRTNCEFQSCYGLNMTQNSAQVTG